MKAGKEDLQRVQEVGPRVAAAIHQFFRQPENLAVVRRLRAAKVLMHHPERARPAAAVLAGKTFVLTGALSGMTREEAERIIVSLGGKVSSAVSRKTSYLLAGSDAGTKLARARELGVAVLDEGAFLAMVEGAGR